MRTGRHGGATSARHVTRPISGSCRRGTPWHDVAMPIWPLPRHATPDGGVRPLTLLGLLTNWQWDWFAGPMLLVLVGVYVWGVSVPVSYTHLRAHETRHDL